jgi:CMP-2-keto-3-deoxyoctulosonic acid synthetase
MIKIFIATSSFSELSPSLINKFKKKKIIFKKNPLNKKLTPEQLVKYAKDCEYIVADIESIKVFENRNEIKVVLDKDNNALYFSREPIPTRSKSKLKVPMKKQICITPFTRDFLLAYNEMKPTPLEVIESIDMMRILENGGKVKMVNTEFVTKAVDTQEDLDLVIDMMKKDELYNNYSLNE